MVCRQRGGNQQGGLGKHSEVRRGGELGPFPPSTTVVHEGVISEQSGVQAHRHERYSSDRSIREGFLVEATESDTRCNITDVSPETASLRNIKLQDPRSHT